MDLSDEQWKLVDKMFYLRTLYVPMAGDGPGVTGAKHLEAHRGSYETGAPWQDLSPRYGAYQTVPRRFQNWVCSGVMEKILLVPAGHLKETGGFDLKECFVDGTFVPAKKRRGPVGKTKRGKGTKIMGVADRRGLPVRPADRKCFTS